MIEPGISFHCGISMFAWLTALFIKFASDFSTRTEWALWIDCH